MTATARLIVFTKLFGSDAFFPVWLTVTACSWLPRALVPTLRPAVFQENGVD